MAQIDPQIVNTIIASGVTLVLGVAGTAGTIYAARGQIFSRIQEQKQTGEQKLIDNALKLHEVYKEEAEELRERLDQIDGVLVEVQTANAGLLEENARLKIEQAELKEENRALRQAYNEVSKANLALTAKIEKLERRIKEIGTGDLPAAK